MTRLWLVRHARPEVADGTCYGALDIPAQAPATLQAAQALAQALPAGMPLRCSPRQRCTALAEAVRALRPDLAVTIDERLREMDFGGWEGRRWDALDAAELKAWTDDFAHHRPGGGESVHDFMARVAQAWREVPDGDAAWITHAGVIRAAALLHAGQVPVTQAAQWPASACGFGQWQVLQKT